MSLDKKTFAQVPNKNLPLKFKNKWLPMEELKEDTLYSFTFSPEVQPKTQNNFKEWYKQIYDFLRQFEVSIALCLYVEADPAGRYHFHGVILIKKIWDFIDFVKSINVCSASEMDSIDDLEYWKAYSLKQRDIFRGALTGTISDYPLMVYPCPINQTVIIPRLITEFRCLEPKETYKVMKELKKLGMDKKVQDIAISKIEIVEGCKPELDEAIAQESTETSGKIEKEVQAEQSLLISDKDNTVTIPKKTRGRKKKTETTKLVSISGKPIKGGITVAKRKLGELMAVPKIGVVLDSFKKEDPDFSQNLDAGIVVKKEPRCDVCGEVNCKRHSRKEEFGLV